MFFNSDPYPITYIKNVSGKNHNDIKLNMCPHVKDIAPKLKTFNVPACGTCFSLVIFIFFSLLNCY